MQYNLSLALTQGGLAGKIGAMKYWLIGLGNPGPDYEETRHNVGRLALAAWQEVVAAGDLELDKKLNALTTKVKVGKHEVRLVWPETMMNNSGKSLVSVIKSRVDAGRLVVIHDDLDLPLGTFKISFNRGSGGHRGVESVARAIKTKEFARLRIGVSSVTPSGKLKKPAGEAAVVDFILGKFKPAELTELKKVFKKTSEALTMIVEEGREKAMGEFN